MATSSQAWLDGERARQRAECERLAARGHELAAEEAAARPLLGEAHRLILCPVCRRPHVALGRRFPRRCPSCLHHHPGTA